MKRILITSVIVLAGCNSYSDLGGNFKLYEYSNRDVYIGYCFNRCNESSLPVVPPTVVAIDHDDNWIIARSENRNTEPSYSVPEAD